MSPQLTMSHPISVLFVVQNDNFPQDSRVFNEAQALKGLAHCWVLAPQASGQRWRESLGQIECFRYPNFMASSVRGIFIEYLLSLFWISLAAPLIVVTKGIRVIHVANPPDFIIPAVSWLKLLGVRIVYDMHDLSTETFRAKLGPAPGPLRHLLRILDWLETCSLRLCDLVVATNESILSRALAKRADALGVVVRNSNPVVHAQVEDVAKPPGDGALRIGFFGLLADDPAAGLENIIAVAKRLRHHQCKFVMKIVGTGPGLARLRTMVNSEGLDIHFDFVGFVPMPRAYEVISSFDFGLVAWGDLPKNHLHTAMKIMDYMCCAVPVCSLNLREQLYSTGGVGLHADNFDTLVDKMVALHKDLGAYETLRRDTLRHFNDVLCWELQQQKLTGAYTKILSLQGKVTTEC